MHGEAVFGAPVPTSDHPTMAVHAALEMRRRLAAWNERRHAAGQPIFRHGIGVHSGIVLAGNIGSPERLSYSLVGDPVNLASRIQFCGRPAFADARAAPSSKQRRDTRRKRETTVKTLGSVVLCVFRMGKSTEVEVWRLRRGERAARMWSDAVPVAGWAGCPYTPSVNLRAAGSCGRPPVPGDEQRRETRE